MGRSRVQNLQRAVTNDITGMKAVDAELIQ